MTSKKKLDFAICEKRTTILSDVAGERRARNSISFNFLVSLILIRRLIFIFIFTQDRLLFSSFLYAWENLSFFSSHWFKWLIIFYFHFLLLCCFHAGVSLFINPRRENWGWRKVKSVKNMKNCCHSKNEKIREYFSSFLIYSNVSRFVNSQLWYFWRESWKSCKRSSPFSSALRRWSAKYKKTFFFLVSRLQ